MIEQLPRRYPRRHGVGELGWPLKSEEADIEKIDERSQQARGLPDPVDLAEEHQTCCIERVPNSP